MKKVIALMFGLVAGTVSFAHQAPDTNLDVVVQSANQKVQVYVAPQTAKTTIKLMDENGHTLFMKTKNAANGLRQRLDLSELGPGSYRLTVAKVGQTVEKTIVITDVPAQKQISLES